MRTTNLYLLLLMLLLLMQQVDGQIQKPKFPLKWSSNHRYFVDQSGNPFLYHAETGWQLYHKLTKEEALEYLVTRKAQGFNTIQTQITTKPEDVNRYGEKPFHNNNDFAQPNEAYHDHVATILSMADSLGLLIVMSGPWLDCCRTGYGMSPNKPYQKNGLEKNRAYGRYLANKFKHFQNLMWIMGGDNDPGADREVIEQLAMGIHETAPQQLICYHASTTHSSTDLFQYAPWLGFSMVYTYYRGRTPLWLPPDQVPEVYQACLREYNKSDVMPFILGESLYEGKFSALDSGPSSFIRRQAYWTLLSGGAGHAYGSKVFSFEEGWKQEMKIIGAEQMGYLYTFFTSLPWWKLVPDQWHKVITKGYGDYGRLNYVTTAVTDDKTLSVSYLTSRQTITADLGKLTGKKIAASWFNPRTGKRIPAGQFSNQGEQPFTPPEEGDWLLVLQGTKSP